MAFRYTLRQLEYLIAVSEMGSIARAAQVLNVSPPSISTGITHLEEELGLPIFVRRHAQGMTPTAAGQEILKHARHIIEQASLLPELAGSLTSKISGPLRIGGLSTFAQIILPGLRRSFVSRYCDVQSSQKEGDQQGLFELLKASRIDVALTYDLDIPAHLDFHPILDLPPFVALSPRHDLAHKDQVSVHDLAPYPMVLLDLPLSTDYFLSFFREAGLRPMIVERTRDMAVMRSLVASDFGYSIANVRSFRDEAPDGRPLRFVPLAGDVRPMRLGLLTISGAFRSNLLRAFVDHATGWIIETLPPPDGDMPTRPYSSPGTP
ncbi:MAG: LysR family transcriptional regulator [Paracoccus sp. (in: a-proteobacteria)]|nr:LysR family transcriptional regulator [Paracoccus sp. (in: a-proteobacteria)]